MSAREIGVDRELVRAEPELLAAANRPAANGSSARSARVGRARARAPRALDRWTRFRGRRGDQPFGTVQIDVVRRRRRARSCGRE